MRDEQWGRISAFEDLLLCGCLTYMRRLTVFMILMITWQ